MEKQFVINELNLFNQINIDFDVYIIADVMNKTAFDSVCTYRHANECEFFSRQEFAEIASAIFNVFGYVKVFYSEVEFIRYMLDHNVRKNECIIYNFARDGYSPGKKSLIPSFADLLNIKYTGSNAFVISLLREKYVYTCLLREHGLSVPRTYKYIAATGFLETPHFYNEKVIVKQNNESASIGMTTENIFSWNSIGYYQDYLYNLCKKMNASELLVQEYIDGLECEVLVLNHNHTYHALDPIGVQINNGEIISSEVSNAYDYSFYLLEDKVPASICNDIRISAEKAASILGIDNYARFDFRIANGIYYLIDIAGTPYTIRHSSVSYLFTQIYKLKYEDIYKTIVGTLFN